MPQSKQLLTVFGATGNQGGSFIRTVLQTPSLDARFALRGVTRDTSKPAAQELVRQGVDVVRADLDEPASLRAAIRGSYGVFAVTNFWETMDGAKETQQGRNITDASISEKVTHLVFSVLPSVSKLTGGALRVPHFDSKAAISDYAESVRSNKIITSYFQPAFFLQNFDTMLSKDGDGKWSITLPIRPEARVPMIDVRADSGKWIAGLFEAGDRADGRYVQAVSFWTDMRTFAQELGAALGGQVAYHHVPADTFRDAAPEAIADELTENMKLMDQYSYFGKGTEQKQPEDDKLLLAGARLSSVQEWAKSRPM